MRFLEEHEQKVVALRQAVIDGEQSGEPVPFSIKAIIEEARKEAEAGSVDV
jgi:antitoxin ParD1/3/4